MAEVQLTRPECKLGVLPPVCVCCGERAARYQRRVFSWSPWWIYLVIPAAVFLWLLPYFLLEWIFNRRRVAYVPLCGLHWHHWRWRTFLLWGLFLGSVSAFAVFIGFVSVWLEDSTFHRTATIGAMVASTGAYAGWMLWVILLVVLKYSAVHATMIGPEILTLTRVAPEFTEALTMARRGHATEGS